MTSRLTPTPLPTSGSDATRQEAGPTAVAWLVAATVLATGLRLFDLAQNSLWIDEYMSLLTARASMGEMPAAALREHALNPPLYFWILHLSIGLLGENETALRLPSVIAGVLTVPLAWALAREVTRSAWIANLSALLFAAHPLHIWYSQEARPYALLVMFSTAALASLAAALRTDRARWWAGYGVASGLALLTHVFGVVPLLVGGLWAGYHAVDRRVLARYAAATLGAVAMALPSIIQLIRATLAARGTLPPQRSLTGFEVPYTIYTFLAGYSLGPPVRELQELGARAAVLRHPVGVAIVGLLGLLLGWAVIRVRTPAARNLWAAFLVPVLGALGASIITGKSFNVRYALPGLMGFIPLLALGVHSLGRSRSALGAGILLGLFLWSDAQWYGVAEYRKEDSRAAVGCLEQVLDPGATVAVAPAYMAPVVAYYSDRDGAAFHIVGIDESGDLSGSPKPAALLLTRLQNVPDSVALRRAFGDSGVGSPPTGAITGYQVYLAEPGGGAVGPCDGVKTGHGVPALEPGDSVEAEGERSG